MSLKDIGELLLFALAARLGWGRRRPADQDHRRRSLPPRAGRFRDASRGLRMARRFRR